MDDNANFKSVISPAEGYSRRSFIKASLSAAAIATVPAQALATESTKPLPPIPTVGDLAAARLSHKLRDLYCSPTAQNELGYVQAAKSVSGITSLSLPPFACCGVPEMPWSPGPLLTCEIFLNDRVLLSYPSGDQLTYQWYPHAIIRHAQVDGLSFVTETFMPSKRRAVVQSIRVKNPGRSSRKFTLGFDMRAAVAKKTTQWFANCPGEADNRIEFSSERGALIFEAQHSAAVSVQGITPKPRVDSLRMLVLDVTLGPGEAKEFRYVNTVAPDRQTALAAYDDLQSRFATLSNENEHHFNSLIKSAFTPGNSDFSGHLPELHTNDEALWNLYHAGFRNLLFARRNSPDSAYGTTYLTLGGRVLPTLSFPWDTSLTSVGLALLDPEALRRLVENWFVQDMHQHLATDYLTGAGVGNWYAVNDMAIIRCARNYLRVTGDFAWLDKRISSKTVIDHLSFHATYWKQLDKAQHGLGDYGKLENLLEVVSTYTHETAGMNAGNVGSMRFVADLLDRRGQGSQAAQLRKEAAELARRINQKLYVAGKGWWKCGQPDGSFLEVRHCYDFLSVLDNMFEDLSEQQKRDMNAFFWNELHTPFWMRSLSPNDVDATWNIRPDHSWLGAYASWPPMTAKGLYKTESSARVAKWLRNVSKAGNQGPIGQAHFVESAFPIEQGGAYKCPTDAPYLNDWCCIGGGAFVDLVIDSIFGADMTLFDGIKVRSRVGDFDHKARLSNVRYQGKQLVISGDGAALQ